MELKIIWWESTKKKGSSHFLEFRKKHRCSVQCSNPGVSNLLSVVGSIYMPEFYAGQTILKNLNIDAIDVATIGSLAIFHSKRKQRPFFERPVLSKQELQF